MVLYREVVLLKRLAIFYTHNAVFILKKKLHKQYRENEVRLDKYIAVYYVYKSINFVELVISCVEFNLLLKAEDK